MERGRAAKAEIGSSSIEKSEELYLQISLQSLILEAYHTIKLP